MLFRTTVLYFVDPSSSIRWTSLAGSVAEAAGLYSASAVTKFLGGSFGGSTHNITGFSPQTILAEGIRDSSPGSKITTYVLHFVFLTCLTSQISHRISQHHYQTSACSGGGGLLQALMTKSSVRSNLTMYTPDIQAVHAAGLKYILGETNSISCHGAPGVSNAAGAAIWLVDYALQASQLGITRLHFHQGIGYRYNWVSFRPLCIDFESSHGRPLSSSSPLL